MKWSASGVSEKAEVASGAPRGNASEEPYNEFALRMTEFMTAIQNRAALSACVDISRDVTQGAYYKALIACRKLFAFEQERLNYEPEKLSSRATGR